MSLIRCGSNADRLENANGDFTTNYYFLIVAGIVLKAGWVGGWMIGWFGGLQVWG